MSVFGYDYGCTPSNLADASAKLRLELTDSDTAFSHVVLLISQFIICGYMNLTQFSQRRAELYGVTTKCPQVAAFHAPHCDSGEHLLRAWHGPRAHLCLSGTQFRTLHCERAPRARAGTPLSLDSAGAIRHHSCGAPLRHLDSCAEGIAPKPRSNWCAGRGAALPVLRSVPPLGPRFSPPWSPRQPLLRAESR